ncbi:helix-turn-helix domain-containing protein [Aureivirga sp. CE67]|uniref:helix-turn-helix domain-containing protein n=1 Tax=Aureivirga sp. CE67 TaxID=1788983 RepID=UPI0018CBCC0E|nr:helix-turn-helix domain-containing protein [Aureivirga sp. CE67]
MKHVEFDKTVCGVDFLLNVIDFQSGCAFEFETETQSADFFQVYFIKKGNGFLKLNDQKIELESNSLVFISKYQHHSWHIDPTTFEGQLLVFQDDFLNEFFSDQYFVFRLLYFYQTEYSLKLNIEEVYLEDCLSKLKEIKQELVYPKSDSVHLIRSLLYYILISINRHYSNTNHIKEAISLDNTAYQFRKLVEKNIQTMQRVEDYTLKMKISRITLNKAVKNQFNVTTTDFIKARLLFEIKMKLIHSTLTVAEIADIYHFSEANHLSRFFKQKTGISPLEYRSDYQNGIN